MDLSTDPDIKRFLVKKGSVVDVKEMRKKFETISVSDNNQNPADPAVVVSHFYLPEEKKDFQGRDVVEKKYLKLRAIDHDVKLESEDLPSLSSHYDEVPKAPKRRSRNKNLNIDKMKSIKTLTTTDQSSGVCQNFEVGKTSQISVRERSKIFELSQPASPNDFNGNNVGVIKDDKSLASVNLSMPPTKPPRTPNKSMSPLLNAQSRSAKETNSVSVSDKTLQKLVDLNRSPAVPKNTTKQSLSKKLMFTSSSSNSNDLSIEKRKTNLRLGSAPEISIDIVRINACYKTESPSTKSVKQPAQSNTINILKDCFNNLTNVATQIRDKVKNKQVNNFVDLSSTTASPPKKYGTLKRSLSDEHIYAEPFQSTTFELHKSRACSDVDVLHYMCTPVIDKKFENVSSVVSHTPPTAKDQLSDDHSRQIKRSKASVRSIIYESFSMLRRIPEAENNQVAEGNISGDSESDVSVNDVQERITYVKSIKKQASSSSICIAPKLFDAILILSASEDGPEVLFKQSKTPLPFDYPLIHHLCFPDYKDLRKTEVYKSEWFHFTLMSGEDEKIFGYCHRILGWPDATRGFCRKLPVAVCILSGINAPLFYKKILAEIEKHLVLPTNECVKYLTTLQKLGVPNAGASVSIPDNSESEPNRVIISRPFDSHTVGMELTRSLQLLDIDVLLKAVASLLLERRVLMLSKSSGNVLPCCIAVSSLLYPFQWQHLMMPIVPGCLSVQCCIESPYLLGIVSTNHDNILDLLGEQQVFVVDVDKGLVLKSFGDEDTILPKKVQKAVIGALNLAKNMTDPTEMMRDIMISEAVVHMFVEMIGHCHDHFVHQNDSYVFQKEAFQKNSPSRSIQSFLQWFSETQMFEAFIEECIWRKTYRDICQLQLQTFFEKRVEEYRWELAYNNDRITRKIVKRVQDFGEKLKGLAKS